NNLDEDGSFADQSFNYDENQVAGAEIATVEATDLDGITSFVFTDTGTDTSADGFFKIDSNGVITITAAGVASVANDFESAPNSGDYLITMTDGAGTTTNATITLSENNLDEDGSFADQSFNYDENQVAGAEIATVEATDLDGITSFVFTDTGTDTSADGFFKIDSNGVITITAAGVASVANDFESAPNSGDYLITMTDGAGTTTNATITLSENNLNEDVSITATTNSRVSEEGLAGGVADTTGNTDTTDSVNASGIITIEDLDNDTLNVSLSGPSTALIANGETVQWSWDTDTNTLTGYIGTPNESSYLEVMSVVLTAPAGNSSGNWNYDVMLLAPVTHPDGTTEDNLSVNFGVNVDDGNGSTTNSNFNVVIEDDAPEANVDDLTITNAIGTSFGQIDVQGADSDYSADLTGNVSGWSNVAGSENYFADSGITTGGETIYYYVDPENPDVLIAYTSDTSSEYGSVGATQSLVFTLTVDPNSGEYELDLKQPITEVLTTNANLTGNIPGGNDEDLFILLQGEVVGEVAADDVVKCSITATGPNGEVENVNTSPNGIGIGSGKDISAGETLILTFSEPVTNNLTLTLSNNNGSNYAGSATFFVSGFDSNGVSIQETFIGSSTDFETFLLNSDFVDINLIELSTADGNDFNLKTINTETITTVTSGSDLGFNVDIIDSDGDVDSDNDFNITLDSPSALLAVTPYAFASLNEANLLSNSTDSDSETLLFKAGDNEVNNFSFGNIDNITVSDIRQPIDWRLENGVLIGSMNGRGDLLKLTLDWDSISAGQQGAVVLDAELLGKLPHNIDVDNLSITGIQVFATDSSGQSVESNVTMNIADHNFAPEFLSGSDTDISAANQDVYNFSFSANNLDSGTLVGSVTAHDIDLAGTLHYSFADGSQDNGMFTINATTGEITLNQDIDTGGTTNHVLNVLVTDESNLTDSAIVNIELTNTNEAPVATDDYFGVGLYSQYFSYSDSSDGGNLSNVNQVRRFINNNEADATFIATTLNYSLGNGDLGTGTSLQEFLGDDAASLSTDPDDSSDAILHMQGFIELDAGRYGLKVTADDGYSVVIDGVVVAEVSRNQSSSTRYPGENGHIYFDITDPGAHSIEIIYWDQGGAYQLDIELGEFNDANQQIGSYTPLGDQVITNEVTVLEDTPYTFTADSIIANDSDPDGDLLTIISVDNAENGTVSLDADGNVIFTPTTGYTGPASYSYTIQDPEGLTDTATVYFDILPDRDYSYMDGSHGDNVLNGTDNHDIIVSDTSGIQIVQGENYNIAFILDSSGSMGASTVATAKEQLIEVFKTLVTAASGTNSGTVNIAVIDFSTSAVISLNFDILDLDIDALINGDNAAWNAITNGGRTDYVDAFNSAVSWFNSDDVTSNSGNNLTYFITDGKHNESGSPQDAFDLLSGLSEVEAVGIKDSINEQDIISYDTDGQVRTNISVDNLADVILGQESALLQGADQASGGLGNDIIFGDLVEFSGINGQGITALQNLVAQKTQVDANDVSVQDIHAFITANPSYFDVANADDGADNLIGGIGNDILFGQGGNDTLIGGTGDDTLIGGLGSDTMTGDEGADSFIWSASSLNDITSTDHITDFNHVEDKLDLSDILQVDSLNDLSQYISFSDDSGSTSINIDIDKDGSFEQQIVLNGVDLTDVYGSNDDGVIINGLLDDGALIVDATDATPAQNVAAIDPLENVPDGNIIP
uniref:Ig-like domain-containing protein n=1 Tax=uncultured Shewanella sp. TaxID=173975 RepID=UPI002609C06D